MEGKVSYRCFKCGGFWTDSETVNKLSAQTLATWRRIKIAANWLSGGSGNCPQDGTKLEKFSGESVPQTMVVKRCIRCGKWWFAGDTLHEFKPAQEAKANYFRMWGMPSNVTGLLLPLAAVVILGMGIGVGVSLNQTKQETAINASVGVTGFSAVYVGGGHEVISFKTDRQVKRIQYREVGQSEWIEAPVTNQEGILIVDMEQLTERHNYEVNILGQDFWFKAER